jgi:3-oxoacyl-[acyl-carrier protein] reductase
LVNNAGILVYKMLRDSNESEISSMVDVNLRGMILCTKAALPKMDSGIIINIASGAGKRGYPGLAPYCATKFGVIGFTESLAMELNKTKIFAICPGGVDTDMYMSMENRHPSLKPEHIASKILDVCENSGKYKSGSCIDVYAVTDILNHLRLRYFGKKA